MSKFIPLLTKALKLKIAAGDIKKAAGMTAYAKQIDQAAAGKVSWDDLKIERNKHLTQATKNVRAMNKALDAVLASTYEMPEPSAETQFAGVLKAVRKYGHDSKEAKRGMGIYASALDSYDYDLEQEILTLRRDIADLSTPEVQARELEGYARILTDAFLKATKVSLMNSALSATMFSLHTDSNQLMIESGKLARSCATLSDNCFDYIKELEKRKKQNRLWMDWAGVVPNEQSLKANARAKKPR